METDVRFDSDGIELAGTLYVGEGGGKRPGIVLGHGFAGARYPVMAEYLAAIGYGVLSLDFRGYGRSGGQRGRVVPSEQASDLKNAVTFMAGRTEIDPDRIGIVGSSLGGSVAIMATADDPRVKVCVAGCPLAKGDSTLRKLYDTEEKYARFMDMVREKKERNALIPRFEIVFIPENLRGFLPKGTPMEFYADTVYGFLSLNPLEMAPRIAPRPLYIIHAKDDHVVPYEDAMELAKRAGRTCKLDLIETGDHFIFGMDSVIRSIGAWLKTHLPVKAKR
jgi:fermentation-respiration switch protein FrsA (DUF1100 family)